MQRSFFFGKLMFFSALLTLLLIIAYRFLPPRVWQWVPADDLQYFVYADDIFGGASYVELVKPDQIHLHCSLQRSNIPHEPFCGFHVYLDAAVNPPAVDLRRFKTMHVNIDYFGDNEKLRFYIREFVEGFSDPNEPIDSTKYMSLYIPAADTTSELTIDLGEFTVADWWVNNHNVPRQYAMHSVKNVVVFGVDVAFPAALGDHELRLNSVSFEGDWVSAENWYLGILLSWIAIIFTGGAITLYQFRRLTSQLSQEKDQYQELFKIDQLTGLMNRHGLSDYFQQELACKENDRVVGIMFIDIDHFKPINDTYGHSLGDTVLRRVAKCIGGHSRQSDTAARWGGEEFLVLMPGTSANEARMVAERLRKSVEALSHPELPNLVVTVSIGVAEVKPGESFDQALKRADAALYKAKQTGRNRVILRIA